MSLAPFLIGVREVTWAEYDLYAESWREQEIDGVTRPTQPDVVNPREPFPDGTVQTRRHPAIAVGRYGALGYCAWLSRKTGRRFRLPTEAEWARAAASSTAAGAWHAANSGGHTRETGSLPPNALGIHDLLGNAWEHCLEPYAPPSFRAAVRGGAWITPAANLDSGLRKASRSEEWLRRDPKWPLRAWWLTDAPFVGLRIAAPADDGASAGERRAAVEALTVRGLRVTRPGEAPDHMARITGELAYSGAGPLGEVEVRVAFTDREGRPIRVDPREKPAFGVAFPVLVHSAHPGPHAAPLRRGGTRRFEVEVPVPFDEVGPVETGPPAAEVTWAGFAPAAD